MALEEQNFRDEFSELVLGFGGIGILIRLGLKMLMNLFPVVKRALIGYGMNHL